jgi:hypothetical protein
LRDGVNARGGIREMGVSAVHPGRWRAASIGDLPQQADIRAGKSAAIQRDDGQINNVQ